MLRNHGIFDYKVGTPTPSYPTDGLIARWTFEDSLNDVYGSNNLSSYGTIAYATGKLGKCVDYNNAGKSYTAAVKSYMIGGNPWSISMWWYQKSVGYYDPLFYFVGTTNPPRFYLHISETSGTDYWYEAMDGTRVYWNQTITQGAWHHHVITFSKPDFKWYVDNGTPHTLSFNVNMKDNNQVLTFGGRADNGASQVLADAYQDNTYFYSKALSAAEVSQLWNGGDGI